MYGLMLWPIAQQYSKTTCWDLGKGDLHFLIGVNRPFYRYGGHIEFIRFKEYYGMPTSKHNPIYSFSIYAHFSGQFFFNFSKKKIVMGKKIVVLCLDVMMIAFVPRNIQWSFLFARKARIECKYWASAPWTSHHTH